MRDLATLIALNEAAARGERPLSLGCNGFAQLPRPRIATVPLDLGAARARFISEYIAKSEADLRAALAAADRIERCIDLNPDPNAVLTRLLVG